MYGAIGFHLFATSRGVLLREARSNRAQRKALQPLEFDTEKDETKQLGKSASIELV